MRHLSVVYVSGGRPRFLSFDLAGMNRAHQILDEVFNARVYFPEIDSRTSFVVRPGDTVIDIGANVGLFAAYAASLSRTGRVYCYEPSSANFGRLEYHKRINRISNMKLFNKAVSDKTESIKLFLLADNCGAHTTVFDAETQSQMAPEYETVESISLKQIFDDNQIKHCQFLKIDCEGAEASILAALPREYFGRIDRIAIEYHSNVDVLQLVALLHDSGFEITVRGLPLGWGLVFAVRR